HARIWDHYAGPVRGVEIPVAMPASCFRFGDETEGVMLALIAGPGLKETGTTSLATSMCLAGGGARLFLHNLGPYDEFRSATRPTDTCPWCSCPIAYDGNHHQP